MASTNKTTNLGLNQWLSSDAPKMADFNADNATIDSVIGKLNSLNTTDKTNLVNAINELLNDTGSLSSLGTTTKANLVAAINENTTQLSDVAHKTGILQTNLNADMIDGIQGSQIPLKTTADITYYVDATNGNNSNNGLANGTAFKTIQHAIDILPQIINNVVTINIAAGTYNEDVYISGFNGKGSISLLGDTTVSSTRNVSSITISSTCKTTIRGLNLTSTGFAIYVVNSLNANINYCQCIVSSSNLGFLFDSSIGTISNSTISNRAQGIYSTNCSTIYSNTNSGTGNTIGLFSTSASTIGKNGAQPGGTTAETSGAGGVIRS